MQELYSKMTDVMLGYDTDIHFDGGDLMTTSGIDYIEREIYKLLITEPGQWRLNLAIGCSPVKFAGEPNTREIAKKLETYIKDGLAFTVSPAGLKVQIVPTDYDSVLLFIDILTSNAIQTTIPFEFNYTNGISKLDRADPRLVVPKTGDYQVNDLDNLSKPNKYWSRLRDSSLSNS
jgi:hypothetical protein